MAPGCTVGRLAGRGSVVLWEMFCSETLGPGTQVYVTLMELLSGQEGDLHSVSRVVLMLWMITASEAGLVNPAVHLANDEEVAPLL